MVCFDIFPTNNPNLGIFWSALKWKMLVHFVVIWNILRPFSRKSSWHTCNIFYPMQLAMLIIIQPFLCNQ
jgi:hypothetical protein